MALAERVAIVTGGAQGLGKEICEVLLHNKCQVCLADVVEETARSTLEEFQDKFGKSNVIYSHCDITRRDSFEIEIADLLLRAGLKQDAFVMAKEAFGKTDILICNAGIADEEKWERMIDVNLTANVVGYKLAEKHMSKNGDSKNSVIFISSVAGLLPVPEVPVYSATKAGLIALTRCWGNTAVYENSGIAVNAVCPSGMRTQLAKSIGMQIKASKTYAKNRKGYFENVEIIDVANEVEKLLEENANGVVVSITDRFGVKHVDQQSIA